MSGPRSQAGSTQSTGASSSTNLVNVTVGVFFDGTLNNKYNTEAREAFEAGEQLGSRYRRGETSFENDLSNVARMEPAYRWLHNQNNEGYQFPVYIEGIATTNYQDDSLVFGARAGEGITGVIEKVRRACRGIANRIHNLSITRIDTLTIDVFGFSRGAAAARNFIYEISKRRGERTGIHNFRYAHNYGHLGTYLNNHGIGVRNLVKRFAGLYETVASFHINHENDTRELHLDAIRAMRHTFHLVAADEHRANFTLTNINSCGSRGVEKILPGVHSDIGGGYRDNMTERVVLNRGIRYNPAISNNQERTTLKKEGWYLDNEFQNRSTELLGVRRNLSNKYSFIPLHVMVEYAIKLRNIHLRFDINTILRDYPITNANDPFLVDVKTRLYDYVFKGDSRMTLNSDSNTLLDLRNRYLHFSADHGSLGMQPNRVGSDRRRQRRTPNNG